MVGCLASFHSVNSPPPHAHSYLLLGLICKFLASQKLVPITRNFPVYFLSSDLIVVFLSPEHLYLASGFTSDTLSKQNRLSV